MMMKVKTYKNKFIFLWLVLLAVSSCLPEQHQIRENISATENAVNDVADTDNNSTESNQGQLEEATNFLQQGTNKTTSTLSVFANFNDSFLIRGNEIIQYLTEVSRTSQTNYCIVTQYPGASGATAKNILVLSARVRSYYSSILNTKEYFLQIEPNNKEFNQLDCLTVSMNSTLTSLYNSTNAAYSIEEVCPDCTTNIASQSLKLYTPSGVEANQMDISYLYLNLIPAAGSTSGSTASCNVNANCTSLGYNCCLSGQCVNHGEVKSGVSTTSSPYLVALQVINSRPELINNYQDIFYVCPEMVPTDTTNGGSSDPTDPIGQANDLFDELTDLYNCLTPAIDEISVCKKDFLNADQLMAGGAYGFEAPEDDLTFSNLNANLTGNNIARIDYAGKTYFKEKLFDTDTEVSSLPAGSTFDTPNDNLTQKQKVTLNIPLPTDAENTTLSLYYKIDGTCQKLGSSLARCSKTYVQGQSSTVPRPSDHPAGQGFALPSYADTSFNVIVNVGGSPVPGGNDTWTLVGQNVVFNSTTFPIFDNQTVEITYFVSQGVSVLTASKEAAQAQVDAHCACDPLEDPCSLTPVRTDVNGVSTITSYACVYPTPDVPDAPLQETFYVSAKAVPHKFYDSTGVNYDLGQIGSAFEQEGEIFEYDQNNKLKPNNTLTSKGFNEIYGTMNNGAAAPVPPTVLEVDKGTTYDIFVDEGAFSTCLNCGTDYYSSMQKIFPSNFEWKGGGYYPDFVESRRRTNQGDHNADDFKFGRACFLPASMIPWTHAADSDLQTQRQNRLAAQHFLFANGYNKDWFGFDYGSIIGSFDGVSWFSIGSQRKITAKSNKLYIAVNAYFGDLTINNSFKVTVSEIVPLINSGSLITHDLDSDGAQCQKAHVCSIDEDCITNLGYEYTCQNVSALITPWPLFDNNGNEITGSANKSLLSLVGGSNGQVKRCVYRGAGAACEQASFNVNSNNSYTQSSSAALHQCSSNTSCEVLTASAFSDRISRFGESPASQNVSTDVTAVAGHTDTFGLAARILGRPFEYYGTRTPSDAIRTQLQTNNVNAICVPGKDAESFTTTEEMNYVANNAREADKILGVGRTFSSAIGQNENYFSACPATDEDGDYTHFQEILLNDSSHQPYAIRNNLSTNSLILNSFDSLNLFNDDENPVRNLGYHKNTCLRAPGAKCFSDFECAPNNFISAKVKTLTSVGSEISQAERDFWEEELVCANSQSRYIQNTIYPNPLYETFEHHCCRETGKDFTYYSQQHLNSDFKIVDNSNEVLIPGVNQDYNDPERYSRTHTVYDKLISEPSTYPPLISAAPRETTKLNLDGNTIKQYNTLHLNNSRMCCTGHWVREFAEGTNGNGGGHTFVSTKHQNIPAENLKPLSWNPNIEPPTNTFPGGYQSLPFGCQATDYFTSYCEMKNWTEGSISEKQHLEWFGKLELVGIPQVLIETNKYIFKPVATIPIDVDDNGTIDYDLQDGIEALTLPIDGTVKDYQTDGIYDVNYGGKEYYSAASYDNLEVSSGNLKKVFSENKFNCCLPTGIQIDANTPAESCCTGLANTDSSTGITACCLPDYTNLSVYTNRYVSSEGARFNGQDIADSDIDPLSGYVKKEIVMQMASTMCCSGQAAYGVAVGEYPLPVDGTAIPGEDRRRWLYDETLDDSGSPAAAMQLYNAGTKWNHHVYCIPADGGSGSNSGGNSSGSVQN